MSLPVTMECAGNGRARLEPRPISQPWLAEAIGTAEWTGVPLAPLLAEAGLAADALEVVFTGLDRGVEGGVEQLYERSLSIADAERDDVLLAYACNGEPLPPQHGFPLRLIVPGWYGMTSVKWLERITVVAEPFEGYQMVTGYRMRAHEDDDGTPVTRIEPRSLMVPPGIPDFLTRRRFLRAGTGHGRGPRVVGLGPDRARRGEHGRRRELARRAARRPARRGRVGAVVVRLGRARGRARAVRPRPRRDRPRPARRAAVEPRRLLEQRGPARARDGQRVSGSSRSAQARM